MENCRLPIYITSNQYITLVLGVQAATDGTIFTMKKSMDQVEQILREASEQLAIAEQKADEQADKHKELTDLAARSDNLLDTIRTRSEEVRCKKL